MKRAPFAVLLAVSLAAALAPGGACSAPPGGSVRAPDVRAHPAPASTFDVEHYALELDIYPETESLQGTCSIRLWSLVDGLERVKLDFAGLEVVSVSDGRGRELRWQHVGESLTIELDGPAGDGDLVELCIDYGGRPVRGLWFAGHRDGVATHVFTQGECEDARFWFPCQDFPSDRATSEVRATFPAAWTSVAAGELVDEVAPKDGRRTQHWRMATPHPSYLVTLVAGEFVTLEGEWDGIPLTYLVEPRWADSVDGAFETTPGSLAFMTELTGLRYPYPKYSQACVQNFPLGGMENISATTMAETMLRDERGYRDYDPTRLVVHEVAHQWFGNLLTCRDWSHIWLNEGLATYIELLFCERTDGVDEFRARMRDAQEDYLAADVGEWRRPIVCDEYVDPMDLFFGGHTYPGGASRLHLLRFVVGDEAFFRGLRHYAAENQGRAVVTADFRRAMEQTSGLDLEVFFDQWLHSPGFPEFEWSWKWDGLHVILDVRQVQLSDGHTPLVFLTPADIEVRTAEGSRLHRVQIDRRRHRFKLPASGEPLWVHFDRHGWIPKTERVARGVDEWRLIASQDEDVNARRDAVAVLAAEAAVTPSLDGRRSLTLALIERLVEDRTPVVRREAATGLGQVAVQPAVDALISAARTDPEADVRTAALIALASHGENAELATVARAAFDEGHSWATMGAAARLLRSAAPEEARSFLLASLSIDSPHDALRASLLTVLASYDDDETLELLLRWATDESASVSARRAAVEQLGWAGRNRPEVSRQLVSMLETARLYRLQTTLIEALGNLEDRRTRTALRDFHASCEDARQKRTIEAIFRQPWTRK